MREIAAAVEAAAGAGCTELVLLACTASYPAEPGGRPAAQHRPARRGVRRAGRAVRPHPRRRGVASPRSRSARCCLEKHVTLDRADGGVDSAFSLEPAELARLRTETEAAWQAARSPRRIGPTESEQRCCGCAGRCTSSQDVRAGDEVTEQNVRSIRPAGGLPPDAIATVLGRRFSRDVSRGTPLAWDLV